MKVYLSIGTNQGNKKENIRLALCKLMEFSFINKISKFYRTIPYGYKNQPNFINFAIEVETNLTPLEFLKRCNRIEEELGRKRVLRWGPRTIDIDILFWEDKIIDLEELKIPHYDLEKRDFVLKPMLDIAPDLVHPILKKSIKELYEELKINHKNKEKKFDNFLK